MALKKRAEQPTRNLDERRQERDVNGLISQLGVDDISTRRWAARDLAATPEATSALLQQLTIETDYSVQKALLDTLESIAGEEVISGLLPLLRSEDAGLRNAVIETLKSMPDSVADHIIDLLNDRDSDVRIFAIDVLQDLPHADVPLWLMSVLKDEQHINVIATAVDRLAEVGSTDMVDEILALKERFPDQFYLHFAIDAAISRIRGGE